MITFLVLVKSIILISIWPLFFICQSESFFFCFIIIIIIIIIIIVIIIIIIFWFNYCLSNFYRNFVQSG